VRLGRGNIHLHPRRNGPAVRRPRYSLTIQRLHRQLHHLKRHRLYPRLAAELVGCLARGLHCALDVQVVAGPHRHLCLHHHLAVARGDLHLVRPPKRRIGIGNAERSRAIAGEGHPRRRYPVVRGARVADVRHRQFQLSTQRHGAVAGGREEVREGCIHAHLLLGAPPAPVGLHTAAFDQLKVTILPKCLGYYLKFKKQNKKNINN